MYLNPGQFVLNTLNSGLSYGRTRQFCLNYGQLSVTEMQFCITQSGMHPNILAFARKVIDTNKDAMNRGAWLGIDGSWNYHRKATEDIVELNSCQNEKIANFEIIFRATRFNAGNCREAANSMECVGTERILIRWTTETRVPGIIRDKHTKTEKVIENCQWKVTQMLDKNHCTRRSCGNGMGSKWLTRKGEAQTISEADLAVKIDIWVNVENHHRGDCTSCPDPNHSGHASAHQADKLAIAVLS
jgi:hypothetical protein